MCISSLNGRQLANVKSAAAAEARRALRRAVVPLSQRVDGVVVAADAESVAVAERQGP